VPVLSWGDLLGSGGHPRKEATEARESLVELQVRVELLLHDVGDNLGRMLGLLG
jgi:hypothetical protein